jgi:hypothetical protein
VSVHKSLTGRTLTVWADLRSIHLSLDGEVLRTVRSRLVAEDLIHLAMRGARPAGPEPDRPALRRANGTAVVRPGDVVEINRTVTKDGVVSIAGSSHLIGFAWAGRRVTLRLDGHLMHAVIDNALIGTWPCPLGINQLGRLTARERHPRRCHRRRYRRDRWVHNERSMPAAASWSPARTSRSAPVTAARSSPSSSKTPICASCTAKNRSPYVHDETSNPSPDFTSQAQQPTPRVVKHLPTTIRQKCPESIH